MIFTKSRENVCAPINQCIYCGIKDVELSDEHIVPFALNGNLVIPKSSCEKCQKIINKEIKSKILDPYTGFYGKLRLRLNLTSRTKKGKRKSRKSHPSHYTLDYYHKGGRKNTVNTPVKGIPIVVPSMICGFPGIILGRPKNELPTFQYYTSHDPNDRNTKFVQSGGKIGSFGIINPIIIGEIRGKDRACGCALGAR